MKIIYMLIVGLVAGSFSYAETIPNVQADKPVQDKWLGKYEYDRKGEKLITGGFSGTTFQFYIERTGILLKKDTYHEPLFCEGYYKGEEVNDLLKVTYIRPLTADITKEEQQGCRDASNSFVFKLKSGRHYFQTQEEFKNAKLPTWHLLKVFK